MDILAAETGWVLGNWGANGRELPDAAPDIPADTDLLIVMLGTNDLLQGRRPKATAERMERFLTGLELARGKIPLFALPSRSPGEWVPGQMLIAASRTFAGCCRTLARRWESIKVRWQNEKFQERIKTFTGWTAQIIQHEIDHCEGIII